MDFIYKKLMEYAKKILKSIQLTDVYDAVQCIGVKIIDFSLSEFDVSPR